MEIENNKEAKESPFLEYFKCSKIKLNTNKEKKHTLKKGKLFSIDSYSNVLQNIEKEFGDSKFFNKDICLDDNFNSISQSNLYDMLEKLLYLNSNILIYGYGSKLVLIYDFLKKFQKNNNVSKEKVFSILIFNAFSKELSVKEILNKIQSFLFEKCERGMNRILGQLNKDSSSKTLEEQITRIKQLIVDFKRICKQSLLIVINNIDASSLSGKINQKILSSLFSNCDIILLATTDSFFINYYWNQSIKDNFGFYYLKYNTFEPYYHEITDKCSLLGENNIKTESGIKHIFSSLTENQTKIIKIIAEYQLQRHDGKHKKYLNKSMLSEKLIEGMISSTTQNIQELLNEPIDHGIIIEKNIEGRIFYKINLEEDVIEKVVKGDYDIN